jgi:cellular nucleic acid-binding protein
MEAFKLGKILENQAIDVQLTLLKLEEVREELKKTMKKRKDLAIAEHDTSYKEIDTTGLFSNGDTKEFDAAIAELMETNRAQAEEIRTLKLEQESNAIMLCEANEQKKRAIEEKAMIEDDKRNIANRLEAKAIEFERISNMQLDTLNQMMNTHHELNMKDIEISTLKMQNEQLQNDLRREKEISESYNKPNEAIKYFEQLLKSPRSTNDTSGLGYTSTEEGESSKSAEERGNKTKNVKPTCHSCGKKGHTSNVCRSRNTQQHIKPKNTSYCYICKKQGHHTHDCRSITFKTTRFEGHCYNCKKYGHRAFECRSKPMWSSNQHAKVPNKGNHHQWDYNTRDSCHYCQEYGHTPENCIRTHFRGNYSRWLCQTTCFSCLKTGHISRNCPTRSKAPSSEFNKGKGKIDVEEVRGQMNKTWKKKDESNTSSEEITPPNRSSGHSSSN